MLTNLKRVFHFAFVDFYRNRGLSVAAIFVLTVTILLVTGLFFLQGVNHYLIETIQNKIDITAYFKADAQEQDILNAKKEILADAPQIKSIEYVSPEAALQRFSQQHAGNSVFTKALSEVGDNPFLPSLNITTSGDTAEYEQVANVLNQDKFTPIIEKVDFSEKKDTIEKVFTITSNVNKFLLGLAGLLILLVILVVFNTIKLVVDASKEEIATMKIVGATSAFVRAPFIIEGGIFGFISFVFCFLVTIFAVYFSGPVVNVIMPGFNLFSFFLSNIFLILLIQIGAGVGLGVIASYIVVRKYLKV